MMIDETPLRKSIWENFLDSARG